MNLTKLMIATTVALTLAGGATLAGAQTKKLPAPYKNAQGKLVCPVMKSVVNKPTKEAGFSDYQGKRYYFCCAGCKPTFDKNPKAFVGSVMSPEKKQKAQEPATSTDPVVKVGKYQIELWPPEDGVYAGEEIDIEFGVFDSSQTDPQLGGMKGIDFDARAQVTMPSMEGMPVQKPNIHKEGRAGVQGLELFFPHGGEYKIALTITPKGGKPMQASFIVDVKDERPAQLQRSQPYELKVVGFPKDATAGKPLDLRLQVVDTKIGKPVTSFDVAHEQKFHLLIASKDLTQFFHEHPTMAPDGTWTHRMTFPAGGEWWVYGDVAPNGKGSRILIAKVRVGGALPSGRAMYAKSAGPFTDAGLTGRIEPVQSPIPIGRMTTLRVRLTDALTGKPAGDTQPWLGAAGHLMIIHEDGQTVVHSHPKEDAATHAMVKRGEVLFTARFPKPGRYIAYSQFKRGGEIKTLGYTLIVK